MSEVGKQPRFWAKTGKGDVEDGNPKYHPVICHLADTAAVAMEIVRSHLSLRLKIKVVLTVIFDSKEYICLL